MIHLAGACLLMMAFGNSVANAQGKEEAELQRVLDRMDSVARNFRTFTARFSQKKFTAVLEEFDTPETGEFYYSRTKDGSVLMRHEVMSPGNRILTIKGETLTVYRPAIKEAQIASREKMQDIVEYLALGIGQNSGKLREKFRIAYARTESVNKAACSVLVFTPKDPKTAARLESITIWLKDANGTPAQYRFQEPTKDYLLLNFFEEKLNIKIPDSKFVQKMPAGVEVQKL
jgi:outer membrane lipoprotein-sorting protein